MNWKIIEDWKKVQEWLLRNFLVALLCTIGLMAISWDWAVVKTMIATVAYACLAIALSGFAVYTYTKIDFIEKGETKFLGQIFIGICLLILGNMLSYFYTSNGVLP